MFSPELKIKIKDKGQILIKFNEFNGKKGSIPFWASFERMPCPGNIKHGPDVDYCRLSIEIETLINYFSNIKSTENGILTIQIDESIRLQINNNAQNIFFHSVWFLLLHSQCSAFKFNQWARGNYLPSTDSKRIYYILFSIFLAEHYFISPDESPDIEKFKSEILMLHIVLKNLLRRIRTGRETRSDSVNNGIALFDTLLIHLLNLVSTEGQHTCLAKRIKEESILAHWV